MGAEPLLTRRYSADSIGEPIAERRVNHGTADVRHSEASISRVDLETLSGPLAERDDEIRRLREIIDSFLSVDIDTGLLNRNGLIDAVKRARLWWDRRREPFGVMAVQLLRHVGPRPMTRPTTWPPNRSNPVRHRTGGGRHRPDRSANFHPGSQGVPAARGDDRCVAACGLRCGRPWPIRW